MNKKTIISLTVLIGIISILVFSTGRLLQKPNRQPITITSYASSVKYTLDDLIVKSDLIVIGEFTEVHPSRWSTLDGNLPESATIEKISEQHLTIFTDSDFHVIRFLKGEIKDPFVRVRTFGGQVGKDRMMVSDEPSYKVGQNYLLFLFRNIGTTANINPDSYYGIGSPFEIVDNKAFSEEEDWSFDDLIMYIEKMLANDELPVDFNSIETPMVTTDAPVFIETLTLTPTPVE